MIKNPVICIKPKVKCNGLFITILGIISLATMALFSQFYWQQAKFVLLFLILLSIACICLGVLKLLEPNISFYISPKKLTFNHRKGQWKLSWRHILSIRPITNTSGTEQEELNYIGLTLDDIETLKESISLRLANHLIHEQQPLLTYCVSHELIKPEQAVMNFEAYICTDGQEIKGPLAGFLHQCQVLKQALGAHLFIANGNIDRSLQDFAVLLKNCKSASTEYQ